MDNQQYQRQRRSAHALPGPDDTLRETLPNGITVLARENFASPAVVVSGYVEAGAEDEPAELHGLTSFTLDMMERGTQHRSFEELYEAVEAIGASFGLSAGAHISSFSAKGLASSLPLLMEIIGDLLRRPAFPEKHVEKVRAEILTDIQERHDSTRRMAARAFHELAYPANHPYHHSLTGYTDTIARIQRGDLVDFHRRHFAPNGLTLVIVGAVKTKDALDIVRETFGDWERTRPARAPLPDAPTLTERRERQVLIPDKMQSNLVLGWPGPSRLHPDFIACGVTNTILGIFGMYGRLGKKVREENGLAYYAYSRIDGGKGPGPWRVIAGVNPMNLERAITLIQEELRRIRAERVPEEELEDSKSFLTGSLPLQLETNEGVAQSLINIERYQLGLDYLQRYRDIIMAITAEDVQAAAQQWLDPENFALAIARPPQPESPAS